MSCVQAAWRFYNDSRLTLQQVFSPVQQHVCEEINTALEPCVLIACDWSNMHMASHTRKEDRVPMSQTKDLGYELFNGLAISSVSGQPFGPVWLELRAADGVHSTRVSDVRQPVSVLDEVIGCMDYASGLTGPPPVFIIDMEADSVAHLRAWNAASHLFVVRSHSGYTMMYNGVPHKAAEIGQALKQTDQFTMAREVEFQGNAAWQWTAGAEVVLTRPASPERKGEPRRHVRGYPLELRLVVTELRDKDGQVLAAWYLLTNVKHASDGTIAQWYYWRWNVESYHKLLKSAGQETEHWGQRTAGAYAKRLAVAAMACLLVWNLARDETPAGEAARGLLVRLSGRQMSRTRPATPSAMLAGLWCLLSTLDALEQYDIAYLKKIAAHTVKLLPTYASKYM